MDVVVVESPAKAKTINKYLGGEFVVLASYGHVRDLPAKDGSVRPDEGFAMTYVTAPQSVKHVKAIAKALESGGRLFLATDPDREGEAISWHVLNALKEAHAVGEVPVKRVVFTEITKRAVLEAMDNARDLDMNLVNAQQARRALDYLVGFTLSPVLWRKLPGAKSAGRVQSVALRLICERELDIEAFEPREYWNVLVTLLNSEGAEFVARLTTLDGAKLGKFSLDSEAPAMAAKALIEASEFSVAKVETKPTRRNPYPPFTTSTLQQEASRKLRFGAKRTMQVAQRLYEGIDIDGETAGLITYMRTDGVHVAAEALAACRGVIAKRFGDAFVPDKPRHYKAAAKNVQEAHEAIRPTDLRRFPEHVGRNLDEDGRRLYELIWKRALASQMESARLEQTGLDVVSADSRVGLRASGTVVVFPGFLKLYEESRDDAKGDDDERRLPPVALGESVRRESAEAKQHFTEPPPRYTEATLVKRLEELGIGRPSTYASILSVLQDRDYVRLEKRRFVPEDRGQLVTAFLTSFFNRYVEYDFTADLENKLDEISAGRVEWTAVLAEFWGAFSQAVAETKELRIKDVITALDELLGPHLFRGEADGVDPRLCPACGDGRLNLKLGRFGAFIGCANYPDCRYTRRIADGNGAGASAGGDVGPRELGSDPESGLPVSLRKGPYGNYIQLGETSDEGKPKRVSLPDFVAPDELEIKVALALLALPRVVGAHPEDGKPITAGIGRYGPYLEHEKRYTKLPRDENLLTIGLNRAVALLAEGKGRRAATPLRMIGDHPADGEPVTVMDGRYGPYIKHKRTNAPLPKGATPDEVTLEQAVELLAIRAAKGKSKGKGTKKSARKSSKAGSKAKSERSGGVAGADR